MTYRSLRDVVADLETTGQLIRVDAEIDARLEIAEIQRRAFAAAAPAMLFTNVRGCRFSMLGNLFGTLERARYLFRHTFDALQRLIRLQTDPMELMRHPLRYGSSPWHAWHALPKKVRRGPVLQCETTVDQLPQLISWPDDGGAYVTLPQVYTEDPRQPGLVRSNLGMYRVQLSGGRYQTNHEVGLHYQLHRGIAAHHQAALEQGQPLPVNAFVGGAPAMTLAAVMPMPEGLSELLFAGILGGRRVPMIVDRKKSRLPIYAEADFCLSGYLDPNRCLPEGPFGDHLGYYSLAHEFPVFVVEKVYHRRDAIWPFTVVGRPPQEDTIFGQLIHELVGPALPGKLPGVHAVHAVDAAGVHPLLLALGSERYVPFDPDRRPRELLTQASAVLGEGQLSLAKYLWIAAIEDDPTLDVNDVERFFGHMLRRTDWRRDLHFQTETTIDTLDYSGRGLHQGSKLIVAARGEPIRELPTEIPADLGLENRDGFGRPTLAMPGVLAVEGPSYAECPKAVERMTATLRKEDPAGRFPLVVVVDDSRFAAESLSNFLWTTFTRSDPASDVYGVEPFVDRKHWGCGGPLWIDARIKPHHAPPLVEDPKVTQRVDRLAARGGPLHGVIE